MYTVDSDQWPPRSAVAVIVVLQMLLTQSDSSLVSPKTTHEVDDHFIVALSTKFAVPYAVS